MKQSSNSDEQMWRIFNQFHYHCDTHRFQKLLARADVVRRTADVPGDIVDCGTFKGISTIQFAHFLEIYRPHGLAKVVSFDTFEAMFPRVRLDEMQSAKDHMDKLYDERALDQITEAVVRLGLEHRVEIVKGDIVETMPKFLADKPGFRISLLHCDLDVYAATKTVLALAWPRLAQGGIVLLDEYAVRNWGESDAVDEFLATLPNPPRLRTLDHTPTPTAYLVKE
ncbi:MAG: class I SAM-dependent methyltransferase [Alphaproteobacteria bacterium]|nr:class I SAM-dependent methyltransferase [Alphaproteobacteria bacterium]